MWLTSKWALALQMRQDEADAVAALLAASGSGEVPGEESGLGDLSGQPGAGLTL